MVDHTMNQKIKDKACIDLSIELPCELAERIQQYADEHNASLKTVVIEAVDAFLRKSKN